MPPTQKELARLAGVSAGTVSNVISGSIGVSERSRRKVLDAIRELNYQPNLIARSLKTNKTNTLGIVVPDITIPFFPKIIRGAESAARERGYFLLVLDSESNHAREIDMIALLRAQRVEGILLVAASGEKLSAERSASLTAASPVVCLDRLPEDLDVDSVCVDDCGAAEMAISHLMGKGHRNIAIITGPLTLQNEQERLKGYRQALQKGGIPFQRSLVWSGSFETGAGIEDLPEWLPAAIGAAIGVICNKRSYRAGSSSKPALGWTEYSGDFSFVTFDELTAEDFFRPGITSVVQPTFDMGYRAVEVLLRRIEKDTADKPLEKVRMPATLVVRDSSLTPLKGSSPDRSSSKKNSSGK